MRMMPKAVPVSILAFIGALSLQCSAFGESFGQRFASPPKDGHYFLTEQTGNTRMPYYVVVGVIVHKGKVISDRSDLTIDKPYACEIYAERCNEAAMARRNTYTVINSTQILRSTPNGKQFVLTWDKPYQ